MFLDVLQCLHPQCILHRGRAAVPITHAKPVTLVVSGTNVAQVSVQPLVPDLSLFCSVTNRHAQFERCLAVDSQPLAIRGGIRRGARAVHTRCVSWTGVVAWIVSANLEATCCWRLCFSPQLYLTLQKEVGQCSHMQNWDWCAIFVIFQLVAARLHVRAPTSCHNSSPSNFHQTTNFTRASKVDYFLEKSFKYLTRCEHGARAVRELPLRSAVSTFSDACPRPSNLGW